MWGFGTRCACTGSGPSIADRVMWVYFTFCPWELYDCLLKVEDPLILALKILLQVLNLENIVEGGMICVVGVSETRGDFFEFLSPSRTSATFSRFVKRSVSSFLATLKRLLTLNSLVVEGNIRSPVVSLTGWLFARSFSRIPYFRTNEAPNRRRLKKKVPFNAYYNILKWLQR